MIANLFFPAKYGLFRRKESSEDPSQDSIPLSRLCQASALRGPIQDNNNRRARSYWYFLCYFLHALLVTLHLILLVAIASHHPENQVIISGDNIESFTTRLSVGLQVFYTLYTAVLVFVTQKSMLSAIFSNPKKLTEIHDICSAWTGFGAALSTLWQQTKVASSVLSIILVTIYFACISVLHVTSSTLIQFQLVNHSTTYMSDVLGAWPNASVDLASLDWAVMTPMVPFLQSLYSATNGLVNNTLYDLPSELGFLIGTVHATTLHANCGLLPNISIDVLGNNTWNVNASVSGLNPGITFSYPPLPNGIWLSPSIQCLEPICSTLILFLISAEMEVDDSIGVNHVFINGTYYSPGSSIIQNFSTPIYFVACSLNSTNHTITIDIAWTPLEVQTPPANTTWSAFLPVGDTDLTSAIAYIMRSANSLPSSPYCQPDMLYPALWENISAFNVYLRSTLGMGMSPCHMRLIAEHVSTPPLLTKSRFESIVSQIAAEFIWLAQQLGSSRGGFNAQLLEYAVPTTTELWSLNINLLPVIFVLCSSIILLVLVIYVLWQCSPTPSVAPPGAGLLEILWFGSRSHWILRSHLSTVQNASLHSLRASAMFETIFWTNASRDIYEDIPLYDLETNTRSSVSLRPLDSENRPSDLPQCGPLHNVSNKISGTRRWCYTLHIFLVALHVVLLVLLVNHPEHSVVILVDNKTMTIGLSALLQAFYTIYSALLVLLMQRLAVFKIISERQKLTAVHDISGAWTGIGAAIYVLWKQYKASSSIREVVAATAYLTMMLILHATSSSIMGWEIYQVPVSIDTQTNLAMPSGNVNISQLVWADIFPVVRSIQETGMYIPGLLNSTIYDVQISGGTWLGAVVNATTLTAQCGLVSNLTLSHQTSKGEYLISFQNGTNNGSFLESPIWKDVIHSISPSTECIACPQTLFYMITTDIDVDDSVHDPVAVGLDWIYKLSEGDTRTSITLTYIAACSLNAQTVLVSMSNISSNQTPSSSTSWSAWSPEIATNLSVGMANALSKGVQTSSFPMFLQGNGSASFTDMDSYIMSLLGLPDLTYANETSVSQSSANPSVTLSLWQLENAISRTAAMFLSTAGLVGENWGGFQPSAGQSYALVSETVWHLNANTIPILVASIASFVSFILAIVIIGKGPSREHPMPISGTSVLECLWLEAHSELLHSRLLTVEEPQLDALRAAGMFDICLGDIGRSSYPETEQPILELGDE